MTPKTVVYSLPKEDKITKPLLKSIKEKAFTRIPIYHENPDNIVGLLNVKQLIGIEENDQYTSYFCFPLSFCSLLTSSRASSSNGVTLLLAEDVPARTKYLLDVVVHVGSRLAREVWRAVRSVPSLLQLRSSMQ